MIVNEDLFLERYNKLNDRQKEAVNTIYGPVMVIAGPGTGKTEVLSMRIANLMRSEAQVQPQEILCLTYTEEATNAMRRRLVQIVGSAAHKVNIFTFHAFCNNIIQANSEFFSVKTLQPITDLERKELLYKILEELPQGHLLRKLSGNIYSDIPRLESLFDLMKKEHYSSAYMAEQIDAYIQSLPEREEYIYKKNGKDYKAGDVKQKQVDEETRKMLNTKAAASLFEIYQEQMKEMGRYDFNDMILWVLDAFQKYPWMLQSYQERYQYILVDEFQDTNGSQNELINQLTSYWEDPNIFVVGDDDQSIYEFQGARIKNITDYYNRYKETIKIVVLPENYRSSQHVIDKALLTIQHNKQRLINQLHELQLNKNIVAAAPRFTEHEITIKPVVNVYNNILCEEADVVSQIETLHNSGISLKDVAILYAQHKQADNIIKLFETKGIPYNVKRPFNVLQEPIIEQILLILNYIVKEKQKIFNGEELLFELMHCPYYGIEPTDIAQLALYMQNSKKNNIPPKWRMVIGSHLHLETMDLANAEAIRNLSNNLEKWERIQTTQPLPLLVEQIIYESGIVAYLLKQPDHLWYMQVLYTFFDFVKDTHLRAPNTKPIAFLQVVQKMLDENISLPVYRVVQNDYGVQMYTAHSSKGNEFEYVFLIGCTKNFWEEKRGSNNIFKLPDTITATEDDTDKSYKVEVARRLFYVALTRAKQHLYISYATNDNSGKAIENSVFIDEISEANDRVYKSMDAEYLVEHMKWALEPVETVKIRMANSRIIEKALQQLTMSVTTLSKYLRCQLAFYYEQILKVPFQRNDALAFGSAIHYALERLFIEMKSRQGEFPTKEELLKFFETGMYQESSCFTEIQYKRRMEQGVALLEEYYDANITTFSTNVEIEFKIPRYTLEGVPITAKIDKIELDGNNITVIDYKTGDPDRSLSQAVASPTEANPNGGDYWRQMVFYKIAIENYEDRHWKVSTGRFDYLQKDKFGKYKNYIVPIFPQDELTVMNQLKNTYASIMNHEFNTGCGKEDCSWCNFAKKYKLSRPADTDELELDDNS